MSLTLRPYQLAAIEQLRASYRAGKRAPLFQLPTGGGKTLVTSAVAQGARDRGNRVLIVVHRRELLNQTSEKLAWAGVEHGFIAADYQASPNLPVQIASIYTAARRLEALGEFDLIVFDEAHHTRALTWEKLIDSQPEAKLLGVTATPARLDGKGLGEHCDGCFDDLICGPSIAQLQKGGYLSEARYFVPASKVNLSGVQTRGGDYAINELGKRVDKRAITADALEWYEKLAAHQPAIAFCALVSHAEHVAEEFRIAGYRSECVHGDLPKAERDRLIKGLGNGEIEVLTSCDLISEGLDVPAVGAVILLRPTKSIVLHMQQIGRGMRPAPGKKHVIVLDHVDNIKRHGRPDMEHIWTLDGVEQQPGPTSKICPRCSHANRLNAEACEVCGLVFEGDGGGGRTIPPQMLGFLRELSADRLLAVLGMSYGQVKATRLSEPELRAYQESRGYKPGWVFNRLREQDMRGSLL